MAQEICGGWGIGFILGLFNVFKWFMVILVANVVHVSTENVEGVRSFDTHIVYVPMVNVYHVLIKQCSSI